MSIINEIQYRVLLFVSEFNKRPDYIILGAKQWSLYIRFFGHNDNVSIEEGNLFFKDIPVIRTTLNDFCEAVGGTEKIKVQIVEEN